MWNHIKLVQKFKSILPLNIKLILIRILVLLQQIYYGIFPSKVENLSKDKKVIYLLLSTDYSNLGDHAMTYAQKLFLEKEFPNAQIVEILVGDTLKYLKYIRRNIKPGDALTLKGGGNIGLEYFREELYRREIIKKFKDNRVIIFPQTVYFLNNKIGRFEFERTKNIFLSNDNLHLFTRDEPSYKQFDNVLNNRVSLVPDIVLSLKDITSTLTRSGAMTAMRSDVEGKYSKEQKKQLEGLLERYYGKVIISDTTTDYPISISQRKKELKKNWSIFMSSEIVLTDRLHGMIFAAITKTPCIVFNTYNYKLIGQYEWLKHLDFIRFINFDFVEIENTIKEIKSNKFRINQRNNYNELFRKIVDLI